MSQTHVPQPPTRVPLEVLRIETPCPADWAAMVGDDRRRFCQGCKKHVHDLSAMPRAEAERLVCESAGDLCIRMTLEADGRVVTVDYESAAAGHRRGWRYWTGVGLAGALVAGLLHGWHARVTTSTVMMGGPMPVGRATLGVMICPPIAPAGTPVVPAADDRPQDGPASGTGGAITSQTSADHERDLRNVLPPD